MGKFIEGRKNVLFLCKKKLGYKVKKIIQEALISISLFCVLPSTPCSVPLI